MNYLKSAILLLFLPVVVYSQTSKLELGIEGGPNGSNLRGTSTIYHYQPMIYGSGGITTQIHFTKMLSLRTGLGYEMKGFKSGVTASYPDQQVFSTFYTRFEYLTIPLMARFTVGKKVRFFVNAGGYLGVLLSKKNEIGPNAPDAAKTYLLHVFKDIMADGVKNYDPIDFGVSAGIGLGVPLNEYWTLSLEARGNMGLTDIRRKNTDLAAATGISGPTRTGSLNLLAGVSYRIKTIDPDAPNKQKKRFFQNDKLTLGIEGGINWSNLGEKRFKSDFKAMTFGSGGFTLQYQLSKLFSIKTGLNYEARGFTYPMTFTYNGHDEYSWFSTRFDFLTVPLMARITLGKKVNFFFNAGGYIGTAMDKKGRLDEDQPGFNKTHTTYLGTYKKRDYGLLAGVGIGVPLTNAWTLSLEARGMLGFADFTEENLGNNYVTYPNINKRWESAAVLFGVSYHVKPKNTENPPIQNNRITIGISGGPNCTFARGETAPAPTHYVFKTYPNAGSSYEISLQWNFKRLVSIRSGLLYEQKSVVSRTRYVSPASEVINNYHLVSTFDYLTIPVLARLTFGKKIQFFCNAGFFISILNKQQDQIEGDYFSLPMWSSYPSYGSSKATENNRSMYKKIDSGLSGGVGIGIPIKKRFYLSAEWRQNYGMRTIFNQDNWKGEYTGIKNGRLLTNSMGFLVGISYKLSFRE